MADETKPKLKARDNPWYRLATLHGEPSLLDRLDPFVAGDDELEEKNRTTWNRWMASEISEDRKNTLLAANRCSAEELRPFSASERHDIRSLIGSDLAGKIDFSNTGFDGPLSFRGFLFPNVTFDRATFPGYADFGRTTFTGDTTFRSAAFTGRSAFGGTMCDLDPVFENATFGDIASFDSATFAAAATFNSAQFAADARFDNAAFSDYADFRAARFAGLATFASATFSGGANFESTFAGASSFKGATFTGGHFHFRSATFSGTANFHKVIFSDTADFHSATFTGRADFVSAKFTGHDHYGSVHFGSVIFSGEADFAQSIFIHRVEFDHATFDDIADFSAANFTGGADFYRATFSRQAGFAGATFIGTAYFVRVTFTGTATFDNVTFLGDALFINAEMGDVTLFGRSTFASPPQFFGAKLHEGTVWRDVVWPKPPTNVEEAGQFVDAYERLKLEMDRLKKHGDELDFFARELECRRVLLGRCGGLPIAIYGTLCGHGRYYMRPLLILVIIVILGAVPLRAHFSGSWALAAFTDHGFGGGAIGLSFANTFGILGIRKDLIDPGVLRALPGWLKVIATVQTICGIVLLFLFGLSIRNRFRMK